MTEKIEFLKQYLPTLRQQLLNKTIREIQTKENNFSNIVTDLDLYIQNELTSTLHKAFPDTVFLTEEAYQDVQGDRMWIIDPIDGTKNFVRRQEDYAVSVAYYEKNQPVFGFVYDIAKDMLFMGIKGQGAWVNGEPIARLSDKTLNQSVLDMNLKTLYAFSDKGAKIKALNDMIFAHRSIGSAAISLCRIALGLHDIYLSSHLVLWDFAAAKIILEEVGGVVKLPFTQGLPMDNRAVALCACASERQYQAIMDVLFT